MGAFGFDEVFGYCWMETRSISDRRSSSMYSSHRICGSIASAYLLFAVPLTCCCLFSSCGPMAGFGEKLKRFANRDPLQLRPHDTTDTIASLATTLARRDIARKAL